MGTLNQLFPRGVKYEGLKNLSVCEVLWVGLATDGPKADSEYQPFEKFVKLKFCSWCPQISWQQSPFLVHHYLFYSRRKPSNFTGRASWVCSLEKTREPGVKTGGTSHHSSPEMQCTVVWSHRTQLFISLRGFEEVFLFPSLDFLICKMKIIPNRIIVETNDITFLRCPSQCQAHKRNSSKVCWIRIRRFPGS